jgi:hypothetical protein
VASVCSAGFKKTWQAGLSFLAQILNALLQVFPNTLNLGALN